MMNHPPGDNICGANLPHDLCCPFHLASSMSFYRSYGCATRKDKSLSIKHIFCCMAEVLFFKNLLGVLISFLKLNFNYS